MKIAIISDIHGNLEALKNCFSFLESQDIDRIFFLGDAIGYLPYGLEVIDFLKKHNVHSLKGNHEAMLLGELPIKKKNRDIYKLDLISENINSDQLKFMQSWKEKENIEINNRKYLLIHGSPKDNLEGYIYPNTNLDGYHNIPYDIIIMGHSHHPFVRFENNKIFINVGSVGLPRDVGNLSSCCIIESHTMDVQIYRLLFHDDELTEGKQSNSIHPSTIECLKRKNSNIIGKVIQLNSEGL